jgi:hypothetical protein
MATSKVKFTVSDGNLFSVIAGADHVASLVFDVDNSPAGGVISADGEVHQIFSLKQAVDLGITGIVDPSAPTGSEYEGGVVHKHIADFFGVNPNGELYVGLAPSLTTDFSFLSSIQTISQGRIRQQGVYTKEDLFSAGTPYTVNFVAAIDTIADADALANRPYSVILHANVATVGGLDVDILQIPTAIGSNERVSINIGQDNGDITKAIQDTNDAKQSVGSVGAFIAAVSLANVHESIGWLSRTDLSGVIPTIAFGFGGVVADIDDNTPYESLAPQQLDAFDEYGYIFPHRYIDFAGVYASQQRTLSSGDFNTIARVRTADKSRRLVRAALLPTLQQPLYIDPVNGEVSVGTINQFKSIVHRQLTSMQTAGEVSGFSITINPKQNILGGACFEIEYRIIPVGTNDQICVELGLATSIA